MDAAYRLTKPVQSGQLIGWLNGIESPTATRFQVVGVGAGAASPLHPSNGMIKRINPMPIWRRNLSLFIYVFFISNRR
jgi:hypothetical protein